MQREIKFRAWDPVNHSMLEWDRVMNTFDMSDLTTSRFIPLQYTGLKDKNGVEIYEGDIVSGGGMQPHKVEWKTKGSLFICANIVPNNYGYNGRALMFMPHEFPNIEVIGNIYENPELLQP